MSNRKASSNYKARPAFTLIELLVVIGIILILIGLLLPMVLKSLTAAKRTRISSDLNAISSALEAYKQDFGDYPRIVYTSIVTYDGTGSGADTLGKALLGTGGQPVSVTVSPAAYDASVTYYSGQVIYSGTKQYAASQTTLANMPGPNSGFWVPVTIPINSDGTGGGFDGADGPGFRLRAGGSGQVYGPYLQTDKFKTRGLSIVDFVGNPIQYFPGNPSKPTVTSSVTYTTGTTPYVYGGGGPYLGTATGFSPGATIPATVGVPCPAFYNYSDGDMLAMNAATSDSNFKTTFPDIVVMEAMLGCFDFNTYHGYIGPGETAASTAPYLLWSAGPDGIFGPREATKDLAGFKAATPAQIKSDVNKCDDVTNFTFGQ